MKFFARKTDPITSHEAAKSVDEVGVTATQKAILELLKRPMVDQDLVFEYQRLVLSGQAPRASESGIRTRRAELYANNKVVPVGYEVLPSNRKAIVWATA